MELDRRALLASLGGAAAASMMSDEAKAEALEAAQSQALDKAVAEAFPTIADLEAEIDTRSFRRGAGNLFAARDSGHVTRLPAMPAAPTLMDFYRLRFAGASNHCLQSAKLAKTNGMDEDIVFACLIHDLVLDMMRANHGHWASQMFEPYVSERVAFALKHHATLRFFPDEDYGYVYPDLYKRMFGEDYVPTPHMQAEQAMVRAHRWYDAPRLVTVNDLYAFDPNVRVELGEFEDVIGRNFRQPAEGLGFDHGPSSHMWRTIADPDLPL
jgi:hypothetical protein